MWSLVFVIEESGGLGWVLDVLGWLVTWMYEVWFLVFVIEGEGGLGWILDGLG